MAEQKLNTNDLESMNGGLIVEGDTPGEGYYIVRYEFNGYSGIVMDKASTLDEAKKLARKSGESTNVVSKAWYKEVFGKDIS